MTAYTDRRKNYSLRTLSLPISPEATPKHMLAKASDVRAV
jgi:hypothetical protein